jgi:hypothetical protein
MVMKILFALGRSLELVRIRKRLFMHLEVAEKAVLVIFAVIPAKAGIQYFELFLDSRLRGSDDPIAFSATC